MSTRSIALARFTNVFRAGRFTLMDVLAVYRSRRALERLDHKALQDVGLTKPEVTLECARPVWDVPQTWRN